MRSFRPPARARERFWQAAAVALAFVGTHAVAQGWVPTKTIEIVVPSAPGGSNDKTARTVERILQEKKLVPTAVVIVNKPGAGNMMTMNYINQHSGDGHYLMIGTPTILTGHIVGEEHQIQAGHPHSNAVGDLFGDDTLGCVSDCRRDFNATIHRARVHHDGVLRQVFEPFGVHPPQA